MKKFVSKFVLWLILTSLFVALFSFTHQFEVKGAKLVFFEDNFESYSVDVFPSGGGWELWYNGMGTEHQVIVNNVSYSPTKSLKLLGLDFWAGFAAKRFMSSSPLIGFEVAVRVEETNGDSRDNARVAFTKKLSGSISCEYAPVTFQDSGTINSGGQILQSYDAKRWYKIKLIMDRNSETYSVWVDDELKGENLTVTPTSGPITSYPSSGIEAFSVSQCYNSVTTYFDDVKIFSSFDANPRLELVPATGIAATTLVGSGFAPNSKISVTWDGTAIPTVPSPLFTDDYGNFTAIISILNQTEGTYAVRAVDEMGNGAIATFTVTLESPSRTQVVVPDDYPTIQEAINHANEGDTITVKPGTYYENVVVTKSISLKGESSSNTIIDGGGGTSVVNVTNVSVVEISGFTIQNSHYGIYLWKSSYTALSRSTVTNNDVGIWLRQSSYTILSGNTVTANTYNGFFLTDSHNATISGSTVTNNDFGIQLCRSNNNTISGNNVTDNDLFGIDLESSNSNTVYRNTVTSNNYTNIQVYEAYYNLISGNNITDGDYGIYLWKSANSIISGNAITNNGIGFDLSHSDDNIFYHNNIIANTIQTETVNSSNIWDDGYPSGGNYWGDYNGTNSDGDGIGDVPYVIDENNRDNYPLMNPLSSTSFLSYKLIVDSMPSGVTFTIDSVTCTAPWSETYNETTSVSLVMPQSHSFEGENYIWWRWSDGDTNRIRTVTVNDSTALTAMFRPEDTSLKISVLSPENKAYATTDVPLEIAVNRIFFGTSYSLDGEANITIIGNTTLTGLSEGPHNIIVHIEDTPGNISSSNIVHFTVDTTPPSITDVHQLQFEINGTIGGTQVNATVTDATSEVEWVALNYTDGNGTWILSEMTNLENDTWSGTIPALPHGTNVTYIIIARDRAQNIITSEELFGYPNEYEVLHEFSAFLLLLIFMVTTLVTVIVYQRRLKKRKF